MKIDETAPVLVTGASGYIASWVVRHLLEAGHTVHATVRDPARKASVEHLTRLAEGLPGTLKLWKADLLEPHSFDAAMATCEVVIHTASPFLIGKIGDPEQVLVRPAVEGTLNVLDSVEATKSVKRVVLTSSVAAVFGDAAEASGVPGGTFTESHWNTTSSVDHNPYPYSKTRAEQEARARNEKQSRWDLVCINPGFVLGPSLTKTSDSYSITTLLNFGKGRFRRGVPRLHFGCVDVRDVAKAHVRAAFTPAAAGRYIVSASEHWMLEIADSLRATYGARFPLPKRNLRKWLVWLLGPATSGISRKYVSLNVGHPVRFDGTRAQRELGVVYRDVAEGIREQFHQLIDDGALTPRG